MPGWLEASLKLGLRRPQLSTDRSHGLLATYRLAEKASKFQSNFIKSLENQFDPGWHRCLLK